MPKRYRKRSFKKKTLRYRRKRSYKPRPQKSIYAGGYSVKIEYQAPLVHRVGWGVGPDGARFKVFWGFVTAVAV